MKHVAYKCPPGCDRRGCPYCDGGLFSCVVCGGLEGSLASECPGERLSEERREAIYRGETDFKGGAWVSPGVHPMEREIQA